MGSKKDAVEALLANIAAIDTAGMKGICQIVEGLDSMPHAQRLLVELFRRWPAFSGIDAFPINGANGNTPLSAFMRARGRLWRGDTRYGRARWQLLEFITSELDSIRGKLLRASEIVLILRELHFSRSDGFGICDNLVVRGTPWMHRHDICCAMAGWPRCSGSETYPVTSGDPLDTPLEAFKYAESYWDRTTQYGRNRWELLEYLMDHFENQLR